MAFRKKSPEEKIRDRIRAWRKDSLLWVKDIFGDNLQKLGKCSTETGLSSQQEEAFREFDKLVDAKLKAFKGEKMNDEETVYSKKIGLSIMSGNGTGKDFWTALTTFSFISRWQYPKVVCTANTEKQLKNVLWSEFSKIARLSLLDGNGVPNLLNMFEVQSEKIYYKHLPKEQRGKEWFVEPVTINTKASEEEQGEALGGRHSDFMLIVVDEASGIPEPVFKPLERTLTGKVNLVIMIFNPTRAKGFAKDSQYIDDRWVRLRWNAEDSELVSRDHINGMEDTYGRESNAFRIGVLGLPPVVDTDTLIHPDWIQDSVERPTTPDSNAPFIMGVDVGAGGDKSIISVRQGGVHQPLIKHTTSDTMILTGHVVRAIDTYEPSAVFIDTIGVGLGVYNRLRELGFKNVYSADVRAAANNKLKFFRRRDELWWEVRDRFEQGQISIPHDRELVDQLNSLSYKPMDSTGVIKIDTKSTLKQRIGHSPDEADAIMLTYFRPDYLFKHAKTEQSAKTQYDMGHSNHQEAWMGA